MTTADIGQTLEVTVERVRFGGFAEARDGDRLLLIPFAAPGDRLRVEVVEQLGEALRARIVDVLTPSPQRREPRCRHFGSCGGCQLQHLDYEAQLELKAGFVRDALVTAGGFDRPEPIVVHRADEWGYRGRTQLKVSFRQPGFHAAFDRRVIPIEECPVLAPALEQALPRLYEALAAMPSGDRVHQIEGACGADGAAFAPHLPGIDKELVEHHVAGFRYLIEPESFFQGNVLLAGELVAGAVDGLSGAHAFDLYAGVGLFTLPLSERFERVTAVEDERRACVLGRVNARLNGRGNVSYHRETTEEFLRRNRQRPDVVLMDPPRLGAARAVPALLELGAERLVYVSCNPYTLARDLRRLVDGGYRIESVAGYDMFPQTYHVECLARLRRER